MRIFTSIIIFILFFSVAQTVFANAKSQIEKINHPQKEKNKFELKLDKTQAKEEPQTIYSSEMTNLLYDDENYRYYKFEKYIKDNIKYSQSGKIKY